MREIKPVKIEMVIMGVRATAASGVSMSLKSGKDLNEEDLAQLMKLLGTTSDVVIIPLGAEEVPAYTIDKSVESKSPSQRLYNTLYVYWKQQGEKGDFKRFYENYIESRIDKIKEELV